MSAAESERSGDIHPDERGFHDAILDARDALRYEDAAAFEREMNRARAHGRRFLEDGDTE